MAEPQQRPPLQIGPFQPREGLSVTFPDGREATVSLGIRPNRHRRQAGPGTDDAITDLTITYSDGGRITIANGIGNGRYDGRSTPMTASGNFPSARQAVTDATTLLRDPEFVRSARASWARSYDLTILTRTGAVFASRIDMNHEGVQAASQRPRAHQQLRPAP